MVGHAGAGLAAYLEGLALLRLKVKHHILTCSAATKIHNSLRMILSRRIGGLYLVPCRKWLSVTPPAFPAFRHFRMSIYHCAGSGMVPSQLMQGLDFRFDSAMQLQKSLAISEKSHWFNSGGIWSELVLMFPKRTNVDEDPLLEAWHQMTNAYLLLAIEFRDKLQITTKGFYFERIT